MKLLVIFSVLELFAIDAQASSRIAGGSVTEISNFPFATALLRLQGTTYRQACGGTIISRNAILSAASCFVNGTTVDDAYSWRARVGSSYGNSQGLVYIVRRVTTHPDFDVTTREHDVAVLRTTLDLVFGDTVQAAYLAGGVYSVASGQGVTAIGWGQTSATSDFSPELRQVTIWVAAPATCADRYGALNVTVTDNMMCAGWLDVGIRGQCPGDTGSPLIHNGVIVGIFSWAEACVSGRYPGVNTRVAAYARWIEATAVASLST